MYKLCTWLLAGRILLRYSHPLSHFQISTNVQPTMAVAVTMPLVITHLVVLPAIATMDTLETVSLAQVRRCSNTLRSYKLSLQSSRGRYGHVLRRWISRMRCAQIVQIICQTVRRAFRL